jgi:Ca2+-binding EF-hand superfamily protein
LTVFFVFVFVFVDRLDQNDEKGVNLLEFVAATIAFSDIANDQILRAAFSIFDRQHIGTITAEDLHGRCSKCIHGGMW